MAADHARLDALLERVVRNDGSIDEDAYTEFRRGLLTHIGIEERVLFPAVRGKGNPGLIEQLHADHAVLAALLVPPPAADEIETIKRILREHNPLEEDPGGFYDEVGDDLVDRVRAYPEARVAPHSDTPHLRRSIEILLKKAGR